MLFIPFLPFLPIHFNRLSQALFLSFLSNTFIISKNPFSATPD